MTNFFSTRLLAGFTWLGVAVSGVAQAAPFTPGNFVVVRVGDGSAALSGNATAVFLVEYTPAGAVVQTIALPTTATLPQRALTASGTSTSELALTRSADGRYLLLTGYDAPAGTAGVSGTAAATTARVIGRIAANGTFDTSTALGDAFTAVSIRGAASATGSGIYAFGGTNGVRYVPFGNPAGTASVGLNSTPANTRVGNVFGGNLYLTSGSAGSLGVSQVGTGLPTTSGQTATLLPGLPGTGSPYGFYFADLSAAVPGPDVLYIADDLSTTSGIQKFSLVGGSWVANGTIGSGTALRGLTASVAGTAVTLYATVGGSVAAGGGTLYGVADNAGYNAAPSALTLNSLATAAVNTAFRGVAPAPVAGVATATKPADALAGLTVFPNPATDRLTVELPTAAPATVALRDLAGRLVLAPAPLAADRQVRLPAGLARGIYLLEVQQGGTRAVRCIEQR